MSVPFRPPVRFGPFEVDTRSGELFREGSRVTLQEQPFQVLAALLERPGEVVAREELSKKLWPEDTFVDFERGLNKAINKLRAALGDDADKPTYIETLPQRGYRFIAPVENLAEGEDRAWPQVWDKRLIGVGAVVLLLICVALWRRQPRMPTVVNTKRITNDGKTKNSLNPFVSDGIRLYFTEGHPSTTGSAIAQVSAAGGETTWLGTTLQNVWAVSPVSPDHSELLVSAGAPGPDPVELWIQPLPGGAPHRVGDIQALLATWSPDGSHIVYSAGDAIMIAKNDGTEGRELAKISGFVFGIRFSPDGGRIRFDVQDPETSLFSLWEMDAMGKNIHALFADRKTFPSHCCGNWSPDGNYYYFAAGRGNEQAIWVMPERNSMLHRRVASPSRLVSGPLRLSSPVPSNDGKKLFVKGEDPRVELLRYDLQGRRFDSYLSGQSAGPVDFSPDRARITYVSYPDRALWRSRTDGSEKMQLTFTPVEAYQPRWSPDGTQIVFMDVGPNHSRRIGLLPAAGGTPEWLTQDGADPTWSPGGKSIVFGLSCDGDSGAIYRLDLQTRKVSLIPESEKLCSPRLSADGHYLSALTLGGTEMKLLDTATNQWSTLIAGQLGFNEWSPDGKYVYVRGISDGAAEVVRVRIKDRVVEHVLSLKEIPQASDIFTWWIGPTPDDGLLLMRDRSVQEIYALDLLFH
jgi:Tol biopolymer transport system component/DNA-binding winged helix-turn-helix (wHTH) protein